MKMMQRFSSRANHRKAVMAAVDVEEIETVRLQSEIRDVKTEHVPIERQQRLDGLHVHDDVAHAESTGAETRDRPARLERLSRKLGLAEGLQPVAGGIGERNQFGHMPLVGERARSARHLQRRDPPAGRRADQARRSTEPSHPTTASPASAAAVDDQALLAIVHAEGARLAAAVDLLHAEQPGRHLAPLVDLGRIDPDIAERGDFHRHPPEGIASAALRRT